MRLQPWTRGLVAILTLLAAGACDDSEAYLVDTPAEVHPEDNAFGPLGTSLAVDSRLRLDGLIDPVDVVRDEFGIVHIYASQAVDAFRAQGYMVARDRAVQLEILRRIAQGRSAEVFANDDSSFIDQDIAMRTIGVHRIAARELQSMDTTSEASRLLAAFADGISQHFEDVRAAEEHLPGGNDGLAPAHFTPWSATDSLSIAKLYELMASFSAGQELALEQLLTQVPQAFVGQSDLPKLARRAGVLPDLMRFAPSDPTTMLDAASAGSVAPAKAAMLADRSRLMGSTRGFVLAMERVRSLVGAHPQLGSNAWAIAPSRSATGSALLAADPHHRLSSPAGLWLAHLDVTNNKEESSPDDLHVAGAAIPGVPGLAHGFGQSVAWASVASRYDLTDLFAEQLTSAGDGVLFEGSAVALETIEESIAIAGADELSYEVLVVPHHGPLLPRIENHTPLQPNPELGAVSMRWAGAEQSSDWPALLRLLRASDVDDARAALEQIEGASRSYVLADVHGDIAMESVGRVPVRDARGLQWEPTQYQGSLPCRVMAGSGSAEWTGWLDVSKLSTRSPSTGFVAAANADPIGGTLDNDPSNDTLDAQRAYLGCTFDIGFRQGRIHQWLTNALPSLTMDDMALLQGDVRSPLGARLTPHLVQALKRTATERDKPGTFPSLSDIAQSSRFGQLNVQSVLEMLDDWKGQADFRAAAGVRYADGLPSSDPVDAMAAKATLVFNVWLVNLNLLVFSDEYVQAGASVSWHQQLRSLVHLLNVAPSTLSSYDPQMRDSILWDDLNTERDESRDEMIVRALLDALDAIAATMGTNQQHWRWGNRHTVRLDPVASPLHGFAVPPVGSDMFGSGFPRPGDMFVVDDASYELGPSTLAQLAFGYTEGPALRLVIEMAAGGPIGRAALAGGQVADPSSPHFSDAVEYWRHNQSHPVPLSTAEVLATAGERIVLSAPSER